MGKIKNTNQQKEFCVLPDEKLILAADFILTLLKFIFLFDVR